MCFSIGWIEQILVWLVIIVAIVAFVRLLLPYILGQLGAAGNVVMQAINIFIWAVVAIFLIYFIFELISCLGGIGMPFRH